MPGLRSPATKVVVFPVKTLEAVESLAPGEVLVSLLPREPRFLFPEIEARGHLWRGEEQPDGFIPDRDPAAEGVNDG